MSFLNRARIDDRNAKAHLAESYNELCQQFSTYTQLQDVGNYKILKQIGEGAFGKVFLAVHKLLHVKVVLKQGCKDDPNVVREVYYQREFRHPNVTKLYEVIVTDSYIYMCLEWCPEGELYDYLLKYRRLPIPKIKKIFSQLCGSVYYIHQLNSCHRDLKLENILLDKKKHVKLADFGFTRELPGKKEGNVQPAAQSTMLETICGTTVYMAPEIIEKTVYSGIQVDIWSLGVILYTLTYGGMPFDEDDELKTKYKILHDEPLYKEDVPHDLISLMKLLLTKDTALRPQSLLQILKHSFLEPYGVRQLDIIDVLLKNPIKPFQTKLERNLLKKLSRLHIDTKELVENVTENRANTLCGFWELMVEKERKAELHKRKKISRSRSVLRLSQAISSSSPKTHSRKNSFNANTLSAILSNGKDSSARSAQNVNFDSYSHTLNGESIASPTKSIQSTTRVNTANSSASPTAADLRKQRASSVTSLGDAHSHSSSTKKTNLLKRLGKFWKTSKKEEPDEHEQREKFEPSTPPMRPQKTISIEVPEPPQQQEASSESTKPANETKPLSPQMMKRSTSSSSGKVARPASMISTYSSYSALTTMSETSIGSDNNTSYSTDNTLSQQQQSSHRPQYYRAKSSEMSIQSRFSNSKSGEPLSSNSSATNISRTNSIDSSRSGSMKNRGRTKAQNKKGNFFMKRGKSPLGQSNRFIINKKKMALLNNRKSRASVIQEEYENSLSNSTSDLSLNDKDLVIPPSVHESYSPAIEGDIDEEDDYFNEDNRDSKG